jgi:hypothetical protein
MVSAAELRVCDGCGRARTIISSRHDRALCASCYNRSEVRPRRRCGHCGRVSAICVRATATSSDVCVDCYHLPVATCVVCRRARPCQWVAAGKPTCLRCVPKATATCAHCGRDRPDRGALGGRASVRHLLHLSAATPGDLRHLRRATPSRVAAGAGRGALLRLRRNSRDGVAHLHHLRP